MAASRSRNRIIVLTGHGKGKSSSAFGMVLRAVGWQFPVCVIQFAKSPDWPTGEVNASQLLPQVSWHVLGHGFTWDTNNPQEDARASQSAWAFARERIASGKDRLIVLDEFNFVASLGHLDLDEVTTFLRQCQMDVSTPRLLILTGRDAPQPLVDLADTVTEMKVVKHAFDEGILSMKGVEF